MRGREVVSEGCRDLAAGVVPLWLLVPLWVALVGGPTLADASTVRGVLVAERRHGLAGVDGLRVEGAIAGDRCDGLVAAERIVRAGAVRAAPPARLRAEPGSPASLVEITAGAAGFFGIDDPARAGLFATRELWQELGRPDDVALDDVTVPLAGVVTVPTHVSDVRRLLVEVVAPVGVFERCLVDRTVARADDVGVVGAVVPRGSELTVVPLNDDLGPPVDGRRVLEERPGWRWRTAPAGGAALVGFVAVRLRRREVAVARHLGASRAAVAGTSAVESVVWSSLAAVVVASGLVVVSTQGASRAAAAHVATRGGLALVVAVVGTVGAGALVAASVRRQDVLRHLRDAPA